MNKHLELLQWCMDNESEDFPISYTFNHGKSWIYAAKGNVTVNCINESEVDEVVLGLDAAKKKFTPEVIKEKRKQALLKELAGLEGK